MCLLYFFVEKPYEIHYVPVKWLFNILYIQFYVPVLLRLFVTLPPYKAVCPPPKKKKFHLDTESKITKKKVRSNTKLRKSRLRKKNILTSREKREEEWESWVGGKLVREAEQCRTQICSQLNWIYWYHDEILTDCVFSYWTRGTGKP